MADALKPGTVLVTRSGGFAGFMIRLGSAFRGRPNLSSHVAVAHHVDAKGVLWCVEGRPGGTGWRDATAYLKSTWTLTNAAQPLTEDQRAKITKAMEALIGSAYDFEAIAADAAESLGMTLPGWDPSWHGTVPAHVVCSSLAAYAYTKAGVPHPAGERECTPGHWDEFILRRAWEKT